MNTPYEMARYTTFRYCLDPTVEQREALQRHCGAARFAFNESLRMVKTKLNQRRMNPDLNVAWTKFELINQFNRWKKSADAGRNLVVDTAGNVEILVTGLPWRNQVCQQVFEEGAADCAKALKGWSDSRSGRRRGRRVRFPRFKKKACSVPSFQEEGGDDSVISNAEQTIGYRRAAYPAGRGSTAVGDHAWHRDDSCT